MRTQVVATLHKTRVASHDPNWYLSSPAWLACFGNRTIGQVPGLVQYPTPADLNLVVVFHEHRRGPLPEFRVYSLTPDDLVINGPVFAANLSGVQAIAEQEIALLQAQAAPYRMASLADVFDKPAKTATLTFSVQWTEQANVGWVDMVNSRGDVEEWTFDAWRGKVGNVAIKNPKPAKPAAVAAFRKDFTGTPEKMAAVIALMKSEAAEDANADDPDRASSTFTALHIFNGFGDLNLVFRKDKTLVFIDAKSLIAYLHQVDPDWNKMDYGIGKLPKTGEINVLLIDDDGRTPADPFDKLDDLLSALSYHRSTAYKA